MQYTCYTMSTLSLYHYNYGYKQYCPDRLAQWIATYESCRAVVSHWQGYIHCTG